MRGGIYLGPAPFTAAGLLTFAADERDAWWPWLFLRVFRSRRGRPPETEPRIGNGRECPALAFYQTGCFAQLAGTGFDAVMGPLCPCERSGARCIDRLR